MDTEKQEAQRVKVLLQEAMKPIAPNRKVTVIPVFAKTVRAGFKSLSIKSILIDVE